MGAPEHIPIFTIKKHNWNCVFDTLMLQYNVLIIVLEKEHSKNVIIHNYHTEFY